MTSPATEQPLKVVAVRLPQSLIDAAQRYADLYHSSVSTLLREGLELRLRPREGTNAPDGQPVLSPGTVAMLHQLARTLTTAAAEVRNVCQAPIEPQQYDGNTTSGEGAYDGNTSRETPGMLDTADLDAMPLAPGDMPPQTDERPGGAPVPPFDTTTHALGDLCRHGHDYHGTGQSLRRLTDGECMGCQSARALRSRQRKRQAGKEGTAPVEAHGEEAAAGAVPAAKKRGRARK